jgi:hypothetical protein
MIACERPASAGELSEHNHMKQGATISELVRRYFHAYETRDRNAIEELLSADFIFTSPLDDHIDRAAYFGRCWPNSEQIKAFHIEKLFAVGSQAFILYELFPLHGSSFRNTEFIVKEGNKIKEVVVFFGSQVGTVGD